jgi:hypothetical protein
MYAINALILKQKIGNGDFIYGADVYYDDCSSELHILTAEEAVTIPVSRW